jgi:hypothetical protein
LLPTDSRYCPVTGSCVSGNGPLGSAKHGKFRLGKRTPTLHARHRIMLKRYVGDTEVNSGALETSEPSSLNSHPSTPWEINHWTLDMGLYGL